MASFGRTVLNYGDYVVRSSDVALLSGTNWLNDVIIGFFMEYLSTEVHGGPNTKLRFVGPEITQCIKLCPDDTSNLLGPIGDFDFIFWVVNNSDDPTALSGGTHWSLLVYSRPENVCAHFDSSSGTNSSAAEALYKIVAKVITPRPTFQPRGCSTQQNGYDCGLHVLCNLEIISDFVTKAKCLNGVHTAKPQLAQAMRTRLVQIINEKVAKIEAKSTTTDKT